MPPRLEDIGRAHEDWNGRHVQPVPARATPAKVLDNDRAGGNLPGFATIASLIRIAITPVTRRELPRRRPQATHIYALHEPIEPKPTNDAQSGKMPDHRMTIGPVPNNRSTGCRCHRSKRSPRPGRRGWLNDRRQSALAGQNIRRNKGAGSAPTCSRPKAGSATAHWRVTDDLRQDDGQQIDENKTGPTMATPITLPHRSTKHLGFIRAC